MKWQNKLLLLLVTLLLLDTINSLKIKNPITKNEEKEKHNKTSSTSDNFHSGTNHEKDFLNINHDSNSTKIERQTEIEENKLLKRKNALTEILKINVSDIDLDMIENSFDASYNTLQLINEKLKILKKLNKSVFRQNKEVETQKVSINLNCNKTHRESIGNKETKTDHNVDPQKLKRGKNITQTANKNNSIVNSSKNETTKLNNTKLEKNITFNATTSSTEEKFNITLTDYLKEKRNSLESQPKAKDSLHNKNRIDSVETETHHMETNINQTISFVNKNDSSTQNHSKDKQKITKSNNISQIKLNEKKIKEKNQIEIESEFPKNMSKESLYTRLINISLSLIVIGVLMGVLVGLILVLYLNSRKEINS